MIVEMVFGGTESPWEKSSPFPFSSNPPYDEEEVSGGTGPEHLLSHLLFSPFNKERAGLSPEP